MSKPIWSVVAALGAALLFAAPASATTKSAFSTGGTATIPNSGSASLYGWTTNVSGFGSGELITDIEVGVLGITHQYLGDIGAVLVSPGGQAFELFDDVDGCSVSGFDMTFHDTAPDGLVPQTCPPASGTFKPTVRIFGASESYPDPGPGLAYANPGPAGGGTATLDGTYGGYGANGLWKLYIV